MTYASDLGLKVGSKIKVLSPSVYFKTGDIIMLTEDDYTEMPWFRGGSRVREPFPIIDCQWEHYKEEEKGVTSATKVEFPCCVPTSEIKDAKTLLALVALFEANGATVYDGVSCGGGHEFDRVDSWDYFGVSLRACGNTFGNTFRTDFYDDLEDYDQSDNPSKIPVRSVAELVGLVANDVIDKDEGWVEWNGGKCPVTKGTVIDVKFRGGETTIGISANMYYWEDGYYDLHRDDNDRMATHWDIDGSEGDIVAYRLHTPSVASQEAITERLEDSPSVGIDYSVMGSTASTEPLITITQEVKYTVVIKGNTFTFTQDELDALTEEMLGFNTL